MFYFCLLINFSVPEGDFVFYSGFNAAVAEASTSDAAFIVALMLRPCFDAEGQSGRGPSGGECHRETGFG